MATYLKSLNESLRELLLFDERVYILGEDILDPYGGAFKVTKGLSEDFPGRVYNTPISEATIVGLAIGMAVAGLRPIVEIMFGDFITLAADQIVNHAAKFGQMYAEEVKVPLLIRTPMGGGRGYGPTHSQCLEKLFLGVPTLRIVAPSQFHPVGNILKYAVQDDEGPVLFIEHKLLYSKELVLSDTPVIHMEYQESINGYPIVILKNYDSRIYSPDVAIITYGGTSLSLEKILEEMQSEEIWIKAVLPSLISEAQADKIGQMIEECQTILIVEEGTAGYGWSSELTASLYEFFGRRCPRIRRVSSAPCVIPAARHMEDEVLPTIETIKRVMYEEIG